MLSLAQRAAAAMCFIAGIVPSPLSLRGGELDDVFQFLNDNAANRTLAQQSEGTLAGNMVKYEFRRERTICNLVRTKKGFSYDAINVIKQRNSDLKDGRVVGEPRIEDRIVVRRCEFGIRESTGEVVGFSRTLTTTREGWAGSTDTQKMKLKDGKLLVEISTPAYDDFFGPGDVFFPGASVDKQTWFLRDGKLVVESRLTSYRVDPTTGERKLLKEYPPQEDTEIAKLPLE